MNIICKVKGHSWTFGKHHCDRCGLLYKYNESEPDTYVKWLDKHID